MLQELMNRGIALGGITICKVNGKPEAIRFDTGYQVAKTDIKYLDNDEALKGLEQLFNQLKETDSWQIGIYLSSDKEITIEPSYHIEDLDRAILIAIEYKQESIYDWKHDDLFWVRYCSVTGNHMMDGYYDEWTGYYYQNIEALKQDYTPEEMTEAFEGGHLYWSDWRDTGRQ